MGGKDLSEIAIDSSGLMLSRKGRLIVLFAAFSGLLFDGIELGLMPIASISVTRSLLGSGFTDVLAADWFARFTAALMLGAAVGGILFGALGDRFGRTRAMGVSILFYSVFSGLGVLVANLEQMLVLRFLVGLGVGGMWPNGVALVSECWSNVSRPMVAGIVGAGLNAGILLLSQIARIWPITPEVVPGEPFHLRFGILIHAARSEGEFDAAAAYQGYLEAAMPNGAGGTIRQLIKDRVKPTSRIGFKTSHFEELTVCRRDFSKSMSSSISSERRKSRS